VPSVRLATDLIAYTVARMPRWNPINVCSYHLQESGQLRCRRSRAHCAPRSPSCTPKDYHLTAIVGRIVDEIRLARGLRPWPGGPYSLTEPAP
jgi:Methylmalonyl-CoA mutase